jgi:hypothetical protein
MLDVSIVGWGRGYMSVGCVLCDIGKTTDTQENICFAPPARAIRQQHHQFWI